MKRISLIAFALLFLTLSSLQAQAQTSQETLNQYIFDLQKNPSDSALREKIMQFVQEMKRKPSIPEDARRHYVKASTLLEDARQPSDSADAAEEFRQALLVAPWWGEAYMKMGLALETAQRYDDAIVSLKLFMATNPQDEVLRKAQDEIYKIEAKREKAAKDKELAARKAVEDQRAQQEAAEAKKASEQEDFLARINGARYIYRFWGKRSDTGADAEYLQTLDARGDTISMGQGLANGRDWFLNGITYKIDGRTLRCFVNGRAMPQGDAIISEDGNTINLGGSNVYKRLR
jgi:tetratricopeptide (TPR) repeat protein